MDTDDGEYIIKASNNPGGTRALIAEWVGSSAARWLGVPIPEFSIVELGDLVEVPVDRDKTVLAEPGSCFGSKRIDADGWKGDAESLRRVENPSAIPAIVVVDTWLRNLDRFCRHRDGEVRFKNPGNVLLASAGAKKGRFRLFAIDFGYAFGGPSWTARNLRSIDSIKDKAKYGVFPEFEPYPRKESIAPLTKKLSGFSKEESRKWLAQVPHEWGLSPDEENAIATFLERRARFVVDDLEHHPWDGNLLW